MLIGATTAQGSWPLYFMASVERAILLLLLLHVLDQCSSTRVPRNPRVPWNMWWGSVSFKGSTRVPRLFREIDFLLQHFDA